MDEVVAGGSAWAGGLLDFSGKGSRGHAILRDEAEIGREAPRHLGNMAKVRPSRVVP